MIRVLVLWVLVLNAAPALASNDTWKSKCERLLFTSKDRLGLMNTSDRDVKSWLERLKEFKSSPTAKSENDQQRLQRLRVISDSIGGWRKTLTSILKDRGLLADDQNLVEGDKFGFAIDRKGMINRWPALSKYEIPENYRLVISPVRHLMGQAAAVASSTQTLYLPVSLLWDEVTSETEMSILHESVHMQFNEIRANTLAPYFALTYGTSGSRREQMALFAHGYEDIDFSGEEIVARAATVEARLKPFCRGEVAVVQDPYQLAIEMTQIHRFSVVYQAEILIPMLANLQGNEVRFTKKSPIVYEMAHGIPELKVEMDHSPMAELWTREPYYAKEYLERTLRIEFKVADSFKKYSSPIEDQVGLIDYKNEDASRIDWRPFCRELNGLSAFLDDFGLKRPLQDP